MSSSPNNKHNIKRYPKTTNLSLKAWNAADEYILKHFEILKSKQKKIAIINDRFGFLSCNLHKLSPKIVINYASQKKAILQNFYANKLAQDNLHFINPLDDFTEKVDLALLKIPKSMDLFRLQLKQVVEGLDKNGIVICGFMTRHFTKQILSIAGKFFEEVEQSLAWKKSRLLFLKKPKFDVQQKIVKTISFESQTFKQYFGVFSSKHIDYASQFLIRNLNISQNHKKVLDLASGNGVLAKFVRFQNTNCEIHLVDDDWLAVESSKMNFDIKDKNIHFHFDDCLNDFEGELFDLIVCNPPFHFEFENNIEVAISLFKQVKRCLKKDGSFQIVANRHLNYKTHLTKMFGKVKLIQRNKKFEIYKCKFPKND